MLKTWQLFHATPHNNQRWNKPLAHPLFPQSVLPRVPDTNQYLHMLMLSHQSWWLSELNNNRVNNKTKQSKTEQR